MKTTTSNSNAWGFGPARLVKKATKEETELVVVVGDLHVPYQDTDAVEAAVALIKDIQPHRVVINGDVADFFQLSRFNDGLERLDDLQAEIDEANAFRKSIRDAAPNALLEETEGNHDHRLRSYVAKNARALTSLRALEPENLFDYKALGITWHPGSGFRLRENFIVKHGTLVRKHAGATAKAEQDNSGISGVSGHTHRLATYKRSGYTYNQWTEGGCLCRLDPDYIVGAPDWQQGLVVGEFSTKSNNFLIHEVPYFQGRMRLGLA